MLLATEVDVVVSGGGGGVLLRMAVRSRMVWPSHSQGNRDKGQQGAATTMPALEVRAVIMIMQVRMTAAKGSLCRRRSA